MGKVPVRLKEVAYTISPYHQHVMTGLWKDIPYKLSKKFHENWVSAFTLVVPIVGTYMYAENYRENEKLHHRY
ncbi:cytochrome b-c1 complex subunit 8-2, mitochondrial [Physcomitrium patens]|uniref:Cytochrome b-c1 complex subunit 8 n=1 Tax=Physcomitrium patens TaxID=3218 RepID=A9TBS9_PHYPA|nr:cytochrome b-c1 complex subunit 8-like [Physcomitrium patens]PNR61648.1 hypothetical protein PHYPA_000071 [Physcomitrium patens]|eukprot:XP_024371295.1 cytochrome b-c1 complex subunit 8-like [Physcomitrella patens]